MQSQEFLKIKLDGLAVTYPATTFRYCYDNFDKDHFVCIDPIIDLQVIIEKEAVELDRFFIRNFPSESLSFIENREDLVFDQLVLEYQPATSI